MGRAPFLASSPCFHLGESLGLQDVWLRSHCLLHGPPNALTTSSCPHLLHYGCASALSQIGSVGGEHEGGSG